MAATEEIIRCASCKYWKTDDGEYKDIDGRQWHFCKALDIKTDEYFYCACGEKEDEDETETD